MKIKKCAKCGVEKELESNFRFRTSRNTYYTQCDECVRQRNLLYNKSQRGQESLKNAKKTFKEKIKAGTNLIEIDSRVCTKCCKEKTITSFHKSLDNKTGRSAICIICWRDKSYKYEQTSAGRLSRLKTIEKYKNSPKSKYNNRKKVLSKFNITPEEYDEILIFQNKNCAVCGNNNKKHSLAVDHSHITGKNRGLLCNVCNYTISRIENDLSLLDKIKDYLENPPFERLIKIRDFE